MLTPTEARARILAALADVAPLAAERVPLAAALGRALAEDLAASEDVPGYDASTMDGYALRATDARAPGVRLPVAFEVFAGGPAPAPLPEGACCRIFTGAPLPEGANAVEMQEEVRRAGKAAVFQRAGERGRFVRRRGSDLTEGEVALRAGVIVDPGAIGLAAGLGRAELAVPRRPRVAILPTGDEIVPVGRRAGPGQVIESNGHALAAAVRDAGGDPFLLPVARDDAASLARALENARGADALVTTGGVSVGTRDLVRTALERAGAQLGFWRVAMRPGKPFTFGRWGRTAVFGLPGNPASALVTFELFARPALRSMMGHTDPYRPEVVARVDGGLGRRRDGKVHFDRVRVRLDGGRYVVEGVHNQESNALASSAMAEGLAILPDGDGLADGDDVTVMLIG